MSDMLSTLFPTSSTDAMVTGVLNTKTNYTEPFDHNSIAIWFYDESLAIDIRCAIQRKLNKTFKCTRIFTDKEKFKIYLNNEFIVPSLTFIISGEHAEELCRDAKEKSKTYDVYELNINIPRSSRKSSNTWFTFNNIVELFDTISIGLKNRYVTIDKNGSTSDDEECAHEAFLPPLGIFNSLLQRKLFYCLDKESSTFLLFQLLNKIIIQMKYDLNDLKNMWISCREKYPNDDSTREKIDDLEDKYDPANAIRYYTEDSFLYRSLNGVLRREDTDGIYKFRCYIADFHKQLNILHVKQLKPLTDEQKSTSSKNEITVYRGKKLPLIVLQQLKELDKSKDINDKFISINGFLSITKKKKVAKIYAGISETTEGYESVIFKMHIDRTITSRVPYAYIADNDSMFAEEKEILFSLGSIWQLTSVKRSRAAVWTIVLRLSNAFDDQLAKLHNQLLIDQSPDDCHLFLLAKILHALSKYPQAGEFYHRLLEKELPKEFKSLIHFNFATMKGEQDQYTEAHTHLKIILNSNQSEVVSTDETDPFPLHPIYSITTMPSRMIIFNTMGLLYQKSGQYSSASNSFREALTEQGSLREEAMVHNNLGNLERSFRNLEEARKHLKKAVELAGNSVWSNQFKKDLENVEQQLKKNKPKHNKPSVIEEDSPAPGDPPILEDPLSHIRKPPGGTAS